MSLFHGIKLSPYVDLVHHVIIELDSNVRQLQLNEKYCLGSKSYSERSLLYRGFVSCSISPENASEFISPLATESISSSFYTIHNCFIDYLNLPISLRMGDRCIMQNNTISSIQILYPFAIELVTIIHDQRMRHSKSNLYDVVDDTLNIPFYHL